MPEGFFIRKDSFAKDTLGGRKALTTGTKQISICVKDFRMADDPSMGMAVGAGYFGFTPEIERHVATNTAGHLTRTDCKTVKELYGTAKGKTAIICGSGRSILDAKPLIPNKGTPEHENLVVFALNASGLALGSEKVDYHFALDYSSRIAWYPEAVRDIPIIMSFNCPDVMVDFFKDRHYFASPLPADKEMREKFGWLDIGSIATYTCMHMAYKMGVTRIIFVGHEFAYTPDSDGTIWNHWNDKVSWEMAEGYAVGMHPDIHGNPVPTDEQLQYNMRQAAAASYMCGDQGIEVINATGRGIFGIQHFPEVCGDRRIEPFVPSGAAAVMTMPLKQALERTK